MKREHQLQHLLKYLMGEGQVVGHRSLGYIRLTVAKREGPLGNGMEGLMLQLVVFACAHTCLGVKQSGNWGDLVSRCVCVCDVW